jgi:hypothetical protein
MIFIAMFRKSQKRFLSWITWIQSVPKTAIAKLKFLLRIYILLILSSAICLGRLTKIVIIKVFNEISLLLIYTNTYSDYIKFHRHNLKRSAPSSYSQLQIFECYFINWFHRHPMYNIIIKKQNKSRGFSPPANYTDRATASCRRS